MTRLAEANAVDKLLWLPKGPVIGPLVVCAFACPHGGEHLLKQVGVRDSKLLPPKQRERIERELRSYPRVVEKISAKEITEQMTKHASLNEIEARLMARALDALLKKIGSESVSRIIIDLPDPTQKRFVDRMRKYLPKEFDLKKIVCKHGADRHYAVVGAASICAKVARDAEIEEIKRAVGEDFGNGYSHNAATVAFLKKHLKNPVVQEFVRQKWVTAKRLKTTQLKLGEYA